MTKASVLFVDDEPNILVGMRRMLRAQRHQWDMTFAESGAAALQEMEKRHFDVVVSDMMMPEMDGAALLSAVRKRSPTTVRIVLSGFYNEESVMRTVGPAHRFLSKPCDPDVLIDAISRAIRLRDIKLQDKLRQFVSKLKTLPTPPEIMMELLEELQSKRATTQSVADILGRDVAMMAETLKLVNSAFFALPNRVLDLNQAVQLLGLDTIRALALIAGIYSQFEGDSARARDIWRLGERSLTIGMIAKKIAELESLEPAAIQEALCAGVLSHIGVLVLIANFPGRFDRAMTTVEKGVETVVEAEWSEFGANHPELGAYLLGLWGFADPIIEGVAYHHEPAGSHCENEPIIGIVHCAQAFAKRYGSSEDQDDDAIPIDTAFLEKTGQLDRVSDWEAIATKVLAQKKAPSEG